jgi:hypothetical protein
MPVSEWTRFRERRGFAAFCAGGLAVARPGAGLAGACKGCADFAAAAPAVDCLVTGAGFAASLAFGGVWAGFPLTAFAGTGFRTGAFFACAAFAGAAFRAGAFFLACAALAGAAFRAGAFLAGAAFLAIGFPLPTFGFFRGAAGLTFFRCATARARALGVFAGADFFFVFFCFRLAGGWMPRLAEDFFLSFPVARAATFFPFPLGISNSHRLA